MDVSVLSISLRMLLSLGLILNGSSLAMTSVDAGMGMGNTLSSAPDVAPVLASMPACHDKAAVPAATDGLDATGVTHPNSPSKSPHPDCCKSGKCACACVHATAALPGIARMEATVFHGSILCSAEVCHLAPVLSELSRPPIS